MTHLHKKSGQTFEVGEYHDGDKTYDIQVISYWKDAETQGVGSPVEIIGYYFGGYSKEDTDFYIDQWIKNREKEIRVLQRAKEFVNDYYTVDKEYMEPDKVSRMEEMLVECGELLYDRSWSLEDNLPPAFKMNKYEYVKFVDTLLQIGDITESGANALLELQINFPEE